MLRHRQLVIRLPTVEYKIITQPGVISQAATFARCTDSFEVGRTAGQDHNPHHSHNPVTPGIVSSRNMGRWIWNPNLCIGCRSHWRHIFHHSAYPVDRIIHQDLLTGHLMGRTEKKTCDTLCYNSYRKPGFYFRIRIRLTVYKRKVEYPPESSIGLEGIDPRTYTTGQSYLHSFGYRIDTDFLGRR